ncbi:MAG: thiamine-phosphate kinase [Hyphomonadaceae bacterium]|nr:thiamine-phosphate kinase [Hyphomonadaceae bacterium]
MRETDWIQRFIVPLVKARGADRLRDDVALLSADGPIIVTMDTLVEGVHFLASDPLNTVGQKLVRVNLSDILAKGAEPVEALLSISWPRGRSETEFGALMAGLERDLDDFGIALIGGDLVSIDGPLTLTLTLTGRCLMAGPVRRSGGRAGQALLINGKIGWGQIGLQAAKSDPASEAAMRYRVPKISSIFAAQVVADFARASMDVSDGLLIDAARLAEASKCGVTIALEQVPLAAETDDLAEILVQCTAGDDYRILISAEPDQNVPGFTKIGQLTESQGLQLAYNGNSVNPPSTLGFEH